MSIPSFKTASDIAYGVNLPDNWAVFKQGVVNKTDTLVRDYKNAKKACANNHPIIRLIQSMVVPLKLPLSRFHQYVEETGIRAAGSAGFTTNASYGTPNNGYFYNSDCQEEYLVYSGAFNVEEVNAKWDSVQSVRPLMIPQSDLSVMYPAGKKYSLEAGITVIAINLPMLMVQYRAWYINQENNTSSKRESIHSFVGGYILPNMMKDHADLLFMNRIYNNWYGFKNGDSGVFAPHPYQTTNYANQAGVMIPKIIANIRNLSNKSFASILQNLPSFSKKNMAEYLVLPDINSVEQTDWLLTAARLKFYALICEMAVPSTAQSNSTEFAAFLNKLRLYTTPAKLDAHLSVAHAAEARKYLEVIYKYSGRP